MFTILVIDFIEYFNPNSILISNKESASIHFNKFCKGYPSSYKYDITLLKEILVSLEILLITKLNFSTNSVGGLVLLQISDKSIAEVLK
jgi:hypothetical protein